MILAGLSNTEVTAICGAIVALAVPINTFMLIVLNRRQKQGNHHAETIRSLANAMAGQEGVDQIPPEELGERVAEAAQEHDPA